MTLAEGSLHTSTKENIRNCVGSPCTPRTRAKLMADILAVPTNFHDNQKKFTVPKATTVNKASRSIMSEMAIPTITLTPKGSSKRNSDIVKKNEKQTGEKRESMIPPSFQPTRTPRVRTVLGDMTPFENRASRLRRQKMEEQRRISMGSATALDTSMNSSFGWK
ncbi:hypothetical protein CAEBREN_00538 [Caenorhabditis brenneri]|uniref:Uncharacterized protein n=1 Tax=Caenorhabditis brenneri TaxID=135651 RepID=G0N6H0_CAEBE|nr:hypothetical protein CAEBREN_00538 [Caenorhabditis brenneri]